MPLRLICTALLAAVLAGVLLVVWAGGDSSALATAGVADGRATVLAAAGDPAGEAAGPGGARCVADATGASSSSPTQPVADAIAAPTGATDVASGATGTTTADLDAFRAAYQEQRRQGCLGLLPADNVRYDACLERYLLWIAGDPSPDPLSAWGHKGEVVRSDGEPPAGCDGNLAGGTGTTGAVAAAKWWASSPHRDAVYRPDFRGDLAHACLGFASVHGGAPGDSPDFVRSASRWYAC
ncbi:hypothetical protein ITJ55_04920 [Frigoribacterium sp. VKM Ac-1396]|uniref:hypothetical protein n=1 Tax=Frigoribacterium sp. VKM Ac-1396 TaxID=2783821 RepID=UPI00188CE71A|nr:hypothetical protein [Frigoribacterium sp. VKM Ac-1396]MBF4600147.1 hypothetical protein [Frigoribacterium sp. VKM Ac-1396]